MSSGATNAHDDFATLSLAVRAAHKAACIPSRLPPDDTVKLQLIGVPAMALVAPDVAARRAKDDETTALPVAAWKPIINRFRLAAAKEQLAEALGQTEGICGRFPESRLRSVDLAIIRQRLYGSPDKWRGRFSATSASVAWLQEFRVLCQIAGWTVEILRDRADRLRAISVSSVIRSDELIVERLFEIDKRVTKWAMNLPADIAVVQRSLAIEAELSRSSGKGFAADEQQLIRNHETGDAVGIDRNSAHDEPSTTGGIGDEPSNKDATETNDGGRSANASDRDRNVSPTKPSEIKLALLAATLLEHHGFDDGKDAFGLRFEPIGVRELERRAAARAKSQGLRFNRNQASKLFKKHFAGGHAGYAGLLKKHPQDLLKKLQEIDQEWATGRALPKRTG